MKIYTTAGSSRGLDATYGGTITASDVDIVTEGAHCAALATDRGEGTVTVTRGTLMTSGEGSPCVYSTGAIRAVDSRGAASNSEIAVVEGKNSIELQNAELTGSVKHGGGTVVPVSRTAGLNLRDWSKRLRGVCYDKNDYVGYGWYAAGQRGEYAGGLR